MQNATAPTHLGAITDLWRDDPVQISQMPRDIVDHQYTPDSLLIYTQLPPG